jgi:hypothetical protein
MLKLRAVIISAVILFSQVQPVFAKTFDVKMAVCLVGSNCAKCNESISVSYNVDSVTRLVTASGTS